MDEKMRTSVFIDTSYVVYYTMFSTWSWYKREFGIAKEDIPENFDPMLDGAFKEEFKAEFASRFDSNIVFNIQNNVPIMNKEKVYFCLDCTRKDIWRREMYPDYKMNRETSKSEIKGAGTFQYVTDKLIPLYVEEGMKVIPKIFGAEGDDVIGVCVKHEFMNGFERNLIITSDTDIYQLGAWATLVKCDGTKVDNESVMKKYNPGITVTPKEYIILKSYSGDTADNISAIVNRCGPKTAQKLWMDKSLLEAKIAKDPMIVDRMERNKILMDMDFIPQDLQDIIMEEYLQVRG